MNERIQIDGNSAEYEAFVAKFKARPSRPSRPNRPSHPSPTTPTARPACKTMTAACKTRRARKTGNEPPKHQRRLKTALKSLEKETPK